MNRAKQSKKKTNKQTKKIPMELESMKLKFHWEKQSKTEQSLDNMVVTSTTTHQANQGARSLAPHRFEAPYCKECYCEIINSVGAKECYSTCEENLY